ncbi:GHMP family kinase ATP-binding protein [Burkholderia sp. Leaf177]|uniref:GHMP family kinase ATP-binding protein n=1 Tax=Burkholderia sp. Leaf177 TaxID=1736287 RepID=UPI0012E3B58B|nr:hypothetical protein [Burkholderia sp. Leaf177]
MESQTYTGMCRGTLGELVQGPYLDGGRLNIAIVSLPIEQYTWVHFTRNVDETDDRELCAKSKSLKALRNYLNLYDLPAPRGSWRFRSELECGKGMASSTADIIATIRCLDAVFGKSTPVSQICEILKDIERSDSVFLDSLALYLSGEQKVVHQFVNVITLYVCYIDEGGVVDTEKSTRKLLDHYDRNLARYSTNMEHAIEAIGNEDYQRICDCATKSAELSQTVFPKKNFEKFINNKERFGSDGMIVAHTGSMLGFLFIKKPSIMLMADLSNFFFEIGYACKFIKAGSSY